MMHISAMFETNDQKKRASLTKKTKAAMIKWAKEANEIDSSKSMSEYYAMFLSRLREKYRESKHKEEFFKDGIIEN